MKTKGKSWNEVYEMQLPQPYASAPKLLAALEGLLDCANVRIDDPRCKLFDAARAVVAEAKGEG